MKKLASLAVVASIAAAGLVVPATAAYAAPPATTVTAIDTTTVNETLQERAERLLAGSGLSAEDQAKIRALVAKLPADTWDRVADLNAKLGIDDTQFAEIAGSAINPDDYQCDSTRLTDWLVSTVAGLGDAEMIILLLLPIGIFPTYDALLYGSESKANRFGINGEYTSLLTSQMKDLRQFWDIQGRDIQLIPMHGADVFTDVNRLARTISFVLEMSLEEALEQASQYLFLLDFAPGLLRGAHPYFTFNAFAFDPTGVPEVEGMGLTKRIVMGDGVLQGFAAIGIDSKVAPRSILAHEYAHQVQFATGLFASTLTGPEATRRTELMADALGTYFMVHSRGEALNAARTLADQETFYNVGDCSFAADGHHGTPNQRFASSGWAVDVVNSAANQGHKLQALRFAELFEAKLPELVAPDAD